MKTIKFSSIGQFRDAIRYFPKNLTSVPYVGYPKIHGTNASLLFVSPEQIIPLSKNNALSIGADNAGFAAWSQLHLSKLLEFAETIQLACTHIQYPFVVSGEWAGEGIQRGVAVNEVPKFFAIFGVGNYDGESYQWLNFKYFKHLHNHDIRLFNIAEFGEWHVEIDSVAPDLARNELVDITVAVEQECPAGKYFGVSGVGEGVVWQPDYTEDFLPRMSETWFKVKGEKHSASKVKKLATVNPEKVASVKEFVEYAVTENRLQQALVETKVTSVQEMSVFLKWLAGDVIKEESDTLVQSGLVWKDVQGSVVNKARTFLMQHLDK